MAERRTMSRALGGPAGSVRASPKVLRRIVDRLGTGESMRAICRDPEMPHRATVALWRRRFPVFDEAVRTARAGTGWGGRTALWCEATARRIFGRLCEGETLTRICADPDMPSFTTVWTWRRDNPAFAEAVALARQIQAERFCDLGWEIASAVTPQDAYATHVKLAQLRWTAACLAPARYGRFRPVTAEAEAEGGADREPKEVVFYMRKFEKVVGPDGKAFVREIPQEDPGA